MNNLLNLPIWGTANQNYLQHVNPWWEKDLIKLLNQQRKWLKKFQQNPSLYFQKENYQTDDLAILFKNSQRYFEFYQQKMRQILQQPRILRKFQKWVLQVGNLAGYLWSLKNLNDFYNLLNQEAVPNKRNRFLILTNDYLEGLWKRYQREVLALLPENFREYFEQLFKQITRENKHLFNPSMILTRSLKDMQKLLQKQKISPETEANFKVMTLLFGGFINVYLQFQAHCLAGFSEL